MIFWRRIRVQIGAGGIAQDLAAHVGKADYEFIVSNEDWEIALTWDPED